MKRFEVDDLPIPGLKRVLRNSMNDIRGFISRIFCAEELAYAGWIWPVAQINQSYTTKLGTVRGMHYQQPPHAEAKLVSCLRGRVWDVAVDLRADSPTFLHWYAQELSAENNIALLIPPGCAHGFQTLTENVELLYAHSRPYVPKADMGLNPQDPKIGIIWPLPISVISHGDASRSMLSTDFVGLHK